MDWFLLLTPLILLPIVLLLVFVGCTLPRAGTRSVSTISLHYEQSVTEKGTGFTVLLSSADLGITMAANPLVLTSAELMQGGDTIALGTTPLDAGGKITCTCTVDGHSPLFASTDKIADEDPLGFELRWEKPENAGGKYTLS